jgi:hypothetical protein
LRLRGAALWKIIRDRRQADGVSRQNKFITDAARILKISPTTKADRYDRDEHFALE